MNSFNTTYKLLFSFITIFFIACSSGVFASDQNTAKKTPISTELKNDLLYERSSYSLINPDHYEITPEIKKNIGGISTYKLKFENKYPNMVEYYIPGKVLTTRDTWPVGIGVIKIYYENNHSIKNSKQHKISVITQSVLSVTEYGAITTEEQQRMGGMKTEYFHRPIYNSVCSSFYINIGDEVSGEKAAQFYITPNDNFYECLNRLFVDFLGLRYSASRVILDYANILQKAEEIRTLSTYTEIVK